MIARRLLTSFPEYPELPEGAAWFVKHASELRGVLVWAANTKIREVSAITDSLKTPTYQFSEGSETEEIADYLRTVKAAIADLERVVRSEHVIRMATDPRAMRELLIRLQYDEVVDDTEGHGTTKTEETGGSNSPTIGT